MSAAITFCIGFVIGSTVALAWCQSCMRKWIKHYKVIGDGVTVKALKRVLHDVTVGEV